jgi:anti-anti-sigma factor
MTNYPDFMAQLVDGILVITFRTPEPQEGSVSRQLGHDLKAAVEDSGTNKVVVDLGLLQYLPSGAFLPLLDLRGRLQSMDGQIVLCRLPPTVADVFHVVGLAGTSESRSGRLDVAVNTALSLQDETDIDLAPFAAATCGRLTSWIFPNRDVKKSRLKKSHFVMAIMCLQGVCIDLSLLAGAQPLRWSWAPKPRIVPTGA